MERATGRTNASGLPTFGQNTNTTTEEHSMSRIEWTKVDPRDSRAIHAIAKRAAEMAKQAGCEVDMLSVDMDITACHISGCRLKLAELLKADDFNFSHDIHGIGRHINRDTGKLENCFLPRFAATA